MNSELTIYPLSENSVCVSGPAIISVELHQKLLSLCDALRTSRLPEIVQIVPAYHTITLLLSPSVSSITFTRTLSDWISDHIASSNQGAAQSTSKSGSASAFTIPFQFFGGDWDPAQSKSGAEISSIHTIPVRYGGEWGPDLDAFAASKRMTVREVIQLHTSAQYYVYMIGFTAGFPYLGGLPDALHSPRREHPRIRVPAGSVGIGGAQTGVYPHEAPGGWHLIGRTDMALFDVNRNPPAVLKPGDLVRFVEVPT